MPTLTQLEYILAVNSTKHFGRAAKECHVSQPSLSAQIQKAEDELGLIIFDRSKKPILVTDKGQQIIDQAKRVLQEHRKLFHVPGVEGEASGAFHLGVIPTLSAYIIPLFLESFSRKFPRVELTISELKTEEIISKLYSDELDGGLLVTPLYEDQIIERSLFFEPFYVYISGQHPLSKKKTIKDTDLDNQSVWLLQEGHCFREQVIKVCSTKNKNQVFKNVRFESGNLETLKNLIQRGHGYTLLPHLATLNLSQADKNKYLKSFIKPIPTREVSLVHSRSFLKEDILSALESEILEQIPPELASLKKGNIELIDI
jgi:LysR family hydrogen peroxide-inducible transcriptional activator